ncbi:hypothetical protein, partial [Microbacterium sp. NPDC056569]|uniref:hypothetical protein n=1 Tax=Microbacterium sp. NPDC056569 TaxID=3345867 RepID=UPI0036720361
MPEPASPTSEQTAATGADVAVPAPPESEAPQSTPAAEDAAASRTLGPTGGKDDGGKDDGKDDDGKDDDGKDDDGKDDDCGDSSSHRSAGEDGKDECDHGGKKAEIKLVKVVVNDDGGNAKPADWTLSIRPDGGSWRTIPQHTWTVVEAGTYKLGESDGVVGYDWTKLECTDSRGTSIHTPVVTLSKDAKVVCTFTNDDRKQPKKGELKLVKKVVNDDGG